MKDTTYSLIYENQFRLDLDQKNDYEIKRLQIILEEEVIKRNKL
jgi:hypothetical protein